MKLIVAIVAALLASCAAEPQADRPKPREIMPGVPGDISTGDIPADTIPPGYARSECKIETESEKGGGIGTMQQGMDAGTHRGRKVVCEHTTIK